MVVLGCWTRQILGVTFWFSKIPSGIVEPIHSTCATIPTMLYTLRESVERLVEAHGGVDQPQPRVLPAATRKGIAYLASLNPSKWVRYTHTYAHTSTPNSSPTLPRCLSNYFYIPVFLTRLSKRGAQWPISTRHPKVVHEKKFNKCNDKKAKCHTFVYRSKPLLLGPEQRKFTVLYSSPTRQVSIKVLV